MILTDKFVSVNYDMNDYLPESSPSTVALNLMDEEFDGGVPNARVMVANVTIPEALAYKEQIEAVDGVTDVTWLDDAVSVNELLEIQDQDTVENYYKDGNALFSVTIDKKLRTEAVSDIRTIIGDDNAITGSAVSTAGGTGALAIHLKIDKNEKCTSDFYDNFALQAALTLDTGLCKNIEADGATMANVGSDKQLSYTVLPGRGLDAYIRADVSDFEMDAVTINGVQLNLDVDIDDAELMDQVSQITDAARDLNDGAGKLSDGTNELLDGGSSQAGDLGCL